MKINLLQRELRVYCSRLFAIANELNAKILCLTIIAVNSTYHIRLRNIRLERRDFEKKLIYKTILICVKKNTNYEYVCVRQVKK